MNHFKLLIGLFSLVILFSFSGCKGKCYDCAKVKLCLVCDSDNGPEAVECKTQGQQTFMYYQLEESYQLNFPDRECTVMPYGKSEVSYCENEDYDIIASEYKCIQK